MPDNYSNRFNRINGIVKITEAKYILYTNYTYIVLDLTQDLPIDHQVEII
jgi:starvation-inducible outer membrane lipoprotein